MGRDSRGNYDGSYDGADQYGRPSRSSGERSVPPSRGGPSNPGGMGRTRPSDPNRRSYGGPSRPPSNPSSPSGYGPAAGPRRASRPGDTPPASGGPRSNVGGPPSRTGMSRPEGGYPPERYDSGRRPADGRSAGPSRNGGPAPERRSMRERAAQFARGMTEQFGAVVENARNAFRNRDGAGSPNGAGDPNGGRRDYVAAGGGAAYGAFNPPGQYSGAMAAALPEQPKAPSQSGAFRRSRIRMLSRKWRLSRRNPNAIWAGVAFAIFGLLLAAILGSVAGGGYYSVSYYEANSSQIAAVAQEANQPVTTFYDRNGNIIYKMNKPGNVNVYLSYDQLSPIVTQATVSTEDRTFWDQSNIGIDWTSTARALLANATSGASQGGSTITQQLVKNLVIDNTNKSLMRKINEGILSVGITESGAYSKAKILEMYLNTIEYANINVGIEAAAERYFGLMPYPLDKNSKTVQYRTCLNPKVQQGQTCWGNDQLDWAQASMLVGIPNAPTIFFPTQWTSDCTNPKTDKCAQPSEWDNPCGNANPLTAPVSACFDGTGNGPADGYAYLSLGHEWLSYRRAQLVLDSLVRDQLISSNQRTDSLAEVLTILQGHKVYVDASTSGSAFGSGSSSGSSSGSACQNTSHQPSDSTKCDNCGVNKCAPHFIDYVTDELINQYGFGSSEALAASGIKVYTTLDLSLDTYAITDAQYYIEYPHRLSWYTYCHNYNPCPIDPPLNDPNGDNVANTAEVAMDPYTGDILAMVGAVDYNSHDRRVDGNVNVATSESRSMGSSTKPIVYATAFQMGWNPGIMVQDDPTCFPIAEKPQTDTNGKPVVDPAAPGCGGNWYTPHNFENSSFSGYIPLRYALADSLNVPATEAMSFVGDSTAYSANILTMAQRMGITSLTADAMGPTTALGTQDISLLQLTNAYSVFPALGKHVAPRSILAITFPDGRPPYTAPTPQAQQAISPQAAYMITSILSDANARVGDFNHPNPLEFNDTDPGVPNNDLGFPAVAAKTGTSQGDNGPRDIVTMGYSPYMALGVWAGNDDSTDLHNVIGISGAGYIFHDIMQYAITHYKWPKGVEFPMPSSMARGTFNCSSGLAPYKDQPNPPSCREDPKVNGMYPGSTGIWAGYGYNAQTDTDWYIKNLPWLQS